MISVIICHHKGELIHKAVSSFMNSLEVEFEIIIASSVPNFSIPMTQTIYVEGGPAHKRNVASRYAKGDYLAFYDDDVEVTPYSLFYQITFLQQKIYCAMTFGKLLNMEFQSKYDEAGSYLTSTGFLWSRAESGVEDVGQFEQAVPILAGKSASCMIDKKVFFEVGGFDASYEILGEETDLAWRTWLAGYTVQYVPQSVTYHAFNTRFKPADFYIPRRVYFNGCRNYLSMLFTNLSYPRLAVPLIIQLIVWTAAGVGMMLTGKHEAGINIFKGLWYFFYHMPSLLRKRAVVQRSRKISDAELLPIILRNPSVSYYVKRFFHYIKTGRHG